MQRNLNGVKHKVSDLKFVSNMRPTPVNSGDVRSGYVASVIALYLEKFSNSTTPKLILIGS